MEADIPANVLTNKPTMNCVCVCVQHDKAQNARRSFIELQKKPLTTIS